MAAPETGAGSVLGHYRLIREIGSGGMGVVFLAYDEQLQREVAIKILPAGMLGDEASRKHFRNEALAVGKLNHPNIAMALDFGTQTGIDYLVTEYVPGIDLDEKISGCPLPQNTIIQLGSELAGGLEAAHRVSVVHRDLKPGNLRINPEGHLKILDFGLATLIHTPEAKTQTITIDEITSVRGTPPYMAPEILLGEPVDARTDIWAAGAVLYEMAAGRRAFPDRQPQILHAAILSYDPVRPSMHNPELLPKLEEIILKALKRDPNARYQSAEELKADLLSIAAQATKGTRRRRLNSAHWAGWPVIAAVVFLSVVLIVAWRMHRPAKRPSTSLLVVNFANRTDQPVYDGVPQELLATALEQSGQVTVFPANRIPDVLKRMKKPDFAIIDDSLASEICTREGLNAILSGSVSKLGASYILVAKVSDCGGRTIASADREFHRPEEMPSALDQIAVEIRSKLGESGSEIQKSSQRLAMVTSSSLEAVQLFSSGKKRLYAGDRRGAVPFFSKAVELDPEFGMAHEYLGVAYDALGDRTRARYEYETAVRLCDRATEREREKVQADFALFNSKYGDAMAHYEVLATLSPEDPAVHLNLAECYRRQFQFKAAIAEGEKASDLVPDIAGPKINLAIYNFLDGNSQESSRLVQQVLRDHPDDRRALYLMGSQYMASRNYDSAIETWKQLIALGKDGESRGRLALADAALVHDAPLEAAREMQDSLLATSEIGNAYEIARTKIILSGVYLSSHQIALARTSLEGVADQEDPELIFLLGRLYAEWGRLQDAQRQVGRLFAFQSRTAELNGLSYMLQAYILNSKGQHVKAVESAKLAVAYSNNSPIALEILARSYELTGDAQKAAQQYEQLLTMSNIRQFDSIDSPAFSAVIRARYKLGVLYQVLGKDTSAKEQFDFILQYAHGSKRAGTIFDDIQRRQGNLRTTAE